MTDQKINIFYKKNKTYSITINPNDKYQYTNVSNYYNRIFKIKQSVSECFAHEDIRYSLHIDISEPKQLKKGTYPRIHFHGCFRFNNNEAILAFLTHTLVCLSQIAYIDIDTLDQSSKQQWFDYCKKYNHITNVMPLQHKLSLQ